MRWYVGERDASGLCRIVVLDEGAGGAADAQRGGRELAPPGYHSPTGVEWGYGGSGPADAALAILLDLFGEASGPGVERTRAFRLHQSFKWAVVARLPRPGWALPEEAIRVAVARIELEGGG